MNISLSERLVAYFALISALAISSVAMFYSVSGLVAIYPTAVVPIVIMGISIEVGKLAMTLWLKQNWNSPALFKWTMIPSVLLLMLITSGGVFGFLSKAHSDQGLVSGEAFSQVQLIDDRIFTVQENIKTQRENIASARTALSQLDNQVNARLDRGTDEASAERSVQIRRNQRTERAALNKEIVTSQNEIQTLNQQLAELNQQKAPLSRELRKVEAEVGPVKYIAALIYGDNPDANLLERAVRYVTLMIVIVLDPVAILLLLASQYSFQQIRLKKLANQIPNKTEEVETVSISTATTSSEIVENIEITADTTTTVDTSSLVETLPEPAETPTTTSAVNVVVYNQEQAIELEPVEQRQPLKAIPYIFEELSVAKTEQEETTSSNSIEELILEDKLNVAVVDSISSKESELPSEDTEEEKLFVQNEEQESSNLWSMTASTHNTISQEEYIEKVRKLKGIDNG